MQIKGYPLLSEMKKTWLLLSLIVFCGADDTIDILKEDECFTDQMTTRSITRARPRTNRFAVGLAATFLNWRPRDGFHAPSAENKRHIEYLLSNILALNVPRETMIRTRNMLICYLALTLKKMEKTRDSEK